MREKIAQAIWENWPHQTVGAPKREWKDVGPNDREATWYPLADAVIKVIQNPTIEMLRNGARSIGGTMRMENHIDRARACLQAMTSANTTPKP